MFWLSLIITDNHWGMMRRVLMELFLYYINSGIVRLSLRIVRLVILCWAAFFYLHNIMLINAVPLVVVSALFVHHVTLWNKCAISRWVKKMFVCFITTDLESMGWKKKKKHNILITFQIGCKLLIQYLWKNALS